MKCWIFLLKLSERRRCVSKKSISYILARIPIYQMKVKMSDRLFLNPKPVTGPSFSSEVPELKEFVGSTEVNTNRRYQNATIKSRVESKVKTEESNCDDEPEEESKDDARNNVVESGTQTDIKFTSGKPEKGGNGHPGDKHKKNDSESSNENCDNKGKNLAKEIGLFALKTAAISGAILGGTALIVPALGFGAAGVSAGSLAAAYQSSVLGGTIASGSVFATLQSIGMAGLSAATQGAIVAGSAVSSAAHSVYKSAKEKSKK